MDYTITIETLENGYTVSVPSTEAVKDSKKDGMMPYDNRYEKSVAKTTGEVLDIVKAALANVPKDEYSEAFDEASKNETKGK